MTQQKNKILSSLACGLILGLLSNFSAASQWPQAITQKGDTITVYQPQPEELKGKTLSGRAAMSIELKGAKDPIWGVFWFTSTIETDRSSDTASISDIKVEKVRWPDSKDSGESRFTQAVEEGLSDSVFTTSISQLKATLAASDKAQKSLDDLKNEPPIILFSDELSILLTFDGKPRFTEIENTAYLRAVNTPLAVAANKSKTEFYLTSGSLWYRADKVSGPWQVSTSIPSELKKLIPAENNTKEKPTKAPAIIATTESTELISTDGKAKWKSLVGGKLMYVENTETPWLRDIASGEMYILLSGRWFTSKKDDGPWKFARADKLPKSFSEIPPESELGGLRTSIAGTDEANEAVMDTQIPQTAAVKRKSDPITVSYDGKPKFEAIKGTEVSYAVNTSSQVLLINKKYYAVENAIWYAAEKATGPWQVADEIPANEIAKIPPSSPAYNTTFVSIYGSTPEVVYVGYTSGYYWSYPYYGVPVYGTGWYYPPYYGSYYYPHPRTWGFHVSYNSHGGWYYGVSWGGPFLSVGIGWGGHHHHGWYGGHHNRGNIVIRNTGNINIGNNINVNNTRIKNRTNNIYKRDDVKNKIAANPKLKRKIKSSKPVDRANNVLADRDGNVVRKDKNKWQSRKDGKWQDIKSRDVSKGQISNKATDFANDKSINRDAINKSNISKLNKINRPSNISRPSTINRPRNINRSNINRSSNFNRSNMNRQFNARSRGGFSGGGRARRR